MGKISGSYESVVLGVSEQVPQDRRSGQHRVQVNMVSDPVRGLARRHPSILQDEVILPTVTQTELPYLLKETTRQKVFPFKIGGTEYDLIYRSTQDGVAFGSKSFAWAFDKTRRKFLPVQYGPMDPTLDQLIYGGVSAAACIGRFILLAGNTLVPTHTVATPYADPANAALFAGWVRGGAYSRTFTLTLSRADGTKVVASYKTVSASYPGELSTSDIAASDPEYQKKVNDRVNAYNSAVTQWIGTAASDITPENIAQKLADRLVALGVTGVGRTGSTVTINNSGFSEISSDDGGDGTLLRAVGNVVRNVDLVSSAHYVGKIVKVMPSDRGEALYLRAEAKDGVGTGWADVVWHEAAGVVMQPQTAFCIGTIENGVLYLAGTPARLATLSGVDVPAFKPNAVGDDLSCPLPDMFGKAITYLGLFQDRLVIGSGSTLLFSRPGDYFNWFRKSTVTVADDDPWEGYAQGSEDDVIRYSTFYDRNLLLYGDSKQYVVNGRQPFVPKTASIVTLASYEDATDAAPQSSGNLVFYSKYSGLPGKETTSLHQVQAGLVQDSPESYEASQQLDRYLTGKPVEIVAMTTPNFVLLRTEGDRTKLYTYSYLDSANGSERLADSWSHWTWHPAVGSMVGVSKHDGAVLVYVLRSGLKRDGTFAVWLACEAFTRESALSDYPYIDSLRPLLAYTGGGSSDYLHPSSGAVSAASVAVGNSGEFRFVGTALSALSAFQTAYPSQASNAWVGFNYDAYATPTNPYARDRNGKAILTGRLTLGRVNVSVADTGGMKVEVSSIRGTETTLDFSGRVLGSPINTIGRQPIVSTNLLATVGGEVREVEYTLRAKTWLPLTITAIEWVGQFFNNTRRA